VTLKSGKKWEGLSSVVTPLSLLKGKDSH